MIEHESPLRAPDRDGSTPPRPRAVVYQGSRRTDRLCADSVAELLERSPWRFDVEFVGSGAFARRGPWDLGGADLYVQPGGGTLRAAYRRLRARRDEVRRYVSSGGRYLGICLGGYLAGSTPGFDLLPGDADRYIDLADASVSHDGETVVPVVWRGVRRQLYFQDGPYFRLRDDHDGDVIARYTNGEVAALVTPFGAGSVGVVGPHPEATADWFDEIEQPPPFEGCCEVAHDLLAALMQPPGGARGSRPITRPDRPLSPDP